MAEDCPICCFEFTLLIRKKITCFNCEKAACASCVKRYILESSSDAKCLHCNISWDRRFMIQNLTKTFCNNDYRNHRRELLFERNKAYYPRISEIVDEKHNLKNLHEKKNELFKQLGLLSREIEQKSREIVNLEVSFVMNEKSTSGDKQIRNRHCITENCMGYLNRIGFCALCKKTTCLNCNVYKTDEEHECKKEDVETWENLKKTTKPCPSCGVRVFKISGCDQMWCTHCNTAFSWKFERIEVGAIHNPHYYDWLFNGGQDAPQILEPNACQEDRLPPFGNILQKLQRENHNISLSELRSRRSVRSLSFYHQQLSDLKHNIVPKLLQNRNRGQTLSNEQSYRLLLYPLLVNFMKGINNKQQIERKDYQFQTDCELAQIVLTFFREQVQFFYLFLNGSEDSTNYSLKSLEKDTEKNRIFFSNAISTFEREYKRTWRPRIVLPYYKYTE